LFNIMSDWFEAVRFATDTQRVIALRMARIASGGPLAASEAHGMVLEKMLAFGEAQAAVVSALATGSSLNAAAAKAYAPYRRRVRANKRRLGP
jgi:hypothetical protein